MIASKAIFVFPTSVQCHTIKINKVHPTQTRSSLIGAPPIKKTTIGVTLKYLTILNTAIGFKAAPLPSLCSLGTN